MNDQRMPCEQVASMTRVIIILSLALTFSLWRAMTARVQSPVTVIESGTLIDGTGGPALADAVVVVRGNKISAVGKRGAVETPPGARVIRADGKFILPGLIDAHVHYAEWQGELHLAHGVTTVKDTGNPVEWLEALSRAIAEGRVVGPRLFYTGNSLTSPPALKDHHVGLQSQEMGRRAVQILKQHGAMATKVHQQITPELLSAVAAEAHKLNLPVTGHLRRIGAREAALAGIDALEHSTGIPRSAGARPDLLKTDDPENDLVGYYDDLYEAAEMREEKFAPLIRLLVEKRVAIVPTLVTWFRVASDHRAAYAQEDATYTRIEALRYVPAGVREVWRTSAIYEPPSAADLERFRAAYAKMSRFLKQFHDAGGRLIAGSAASVMVPGLSLHRELEMMVELGLAPREVIEMATRRNAEFLRMDKELGTIAAGKLADLIVVERNPLEDIKNIRKITLVMQGGKVIDRSYHPDYAMPIPRPKLSRPVWLELQLK
jgi:imidazolonepropionase-like amidohydrolase